MQEYFKYFVFFLKQENTQRILAKLDGILVLYLMHSLHDQLFIQTRPLENGSG